MDETPEQRIEKATNPYVTYAFNPNRSKRKYTGERTHPRHNMRHSSHMMLTESLIFFC